MEFKSNKQEVLTAKDKAVQTALEAIGLVAEGYAKALTPVDTGRLRNSMTHEVADDSAIIGTAVDYGIYVEIGTHGRTGVHMLQQAATGHSDEYKEIALNALKNA